jgi:hypothetical protein
LVDARNIGLELSFILALQGEDQYRAARSIDGFLMPSFAYAALNLSGHWQTYLTPYGATSVIFWSFVMSIEQARMAFLTHSLIQLAIEQHNRSLEMAAIQEMRRKLAIMGSAEVAEAVEGFRLA